MIWNTMYYYIKSEKTRVRESKYLGSGMTPTNTNRDYLYQLWAANTVFVVDEISTDGQKATLSRHNMKADNSPQNNISFSNS